MSVPHPLGHVGAIGAGHGKQGDIHPGNVTTLLSHGSECKEQEGDFPKPVSYGCSCCCTIVVVVTVTVVVVCPC